jgi:hypothetical protein
LTTWDVVWNSEGATSWHGEEEGEKRVRQEVKRGWMMVAILDFGFWILDYFSVQYATSGKREKSKIVNLKSKIACVNHFLEGHPSKKWFTICN